MEAQQQEIHGQVPRIGLMTEAPPPIPEPIRRDEITGFDDVFVRFPLSGIWGDGRNRRYYRIHQNPRQLLTLLFFLSTYIYNEFQNPTTKSSTSFPDRRCG